MASRPIKIKTGVLNRLVKEERTYRDEAEAQKRTVDAYVAQGKDDWDIKNARKVLADTEKMIPDAQQRLARALAELRDLVDAHAEELEGTEELQKARTAIEEANV